MKMCMFKSRFQSEWEALMQSVLACNAHIKT